MNQYQNQYQYRQPIKWGVIIVWFIFFFPLGFYFLMREYRNKRTLFEYGKMMQKTGIVCICIGLFYMFFMQMAPMTSSEGAAVTASERFSIGLMMLIVFGLIGISFLIGGINKKKQAAVLQSAAEEQRILNQNAEFEANHPFTEAICPSCGAHIRARKGIETQCDYCGNKIVG